jgi:two-component system NarL family sensor kinase
MLRRLPIESNTPVQVFAATRMAAVVVALVAVLALALPDAAEAALVLGGLALPWTVVGLVVARRRPELAVSPVVPVVDFALLVLLEAVAPELLGAVRLAALFLIAAHADFQGGRRGIAVAAFGSIALVVATQLRGDEPVSGNVLVFYEVAFVLAALATGLVVGLSRTAESASRLRARGLSRRSLQAENEVRRRVAESLHDGPVQELIALDMILSAAARAADEGRAEESAGLIEEARELASRNVDTLRDEIVDLGPYAFRELSFDTAVQNCMPVWKRRYGFEVMATLQRIDLAPQVAGDLFRIVQEAVINAGRHAQADTISINLRTVGGLVELRVTDNGHGFVNGDPLGADEPGHFGLASIRERAELLDGELDIETSELGTRVLVTVPLRRP